MKILKIFLIFLFFSKNSYSDELLPEFSFVDTNGVNHSISEWKGKKLVINFWATWCQPCLKEIPEFVGLQKQFEKKNVQFIGIAIDEPLAVSNYKKTTNINYPILISNEWEGFNLAQQLGNQSNTVPYTIVVNRDEKIIFRHAGSVKKEDLLPILEKGE